MENLKHGDTDGIVTFTFSEDNTPVDISAKTAFAIFKHRTSGLATTIALENESSDGTATWQPTTLQYAILRPGAYDVEGYTLTAGGAKRTFPTIGVAEIIIDPTLV